MARENPAGRRPRIRKTAPTVRERQQAAAIQRETPKPRRLKRAAQTAGKPFNNLRLAERRPVKVLARLLRPIRRVLTWIAPKYFINAWREVRQVVWPNRRETWRLTLAVFVFAIVFGAMVAGVDKGLDEIFKKVVLK